MTSVGLRSCPLKERFSSHQYCTPQLHGIPHFELNATLCHFESLSYENVGLRSCPMVERLSIRQNSEWTPAACQAAL